MHNPPRVLILTSVHEPFDPRIFHRQARALAAPGYSVTLLAPFAGQAQTLDGVRVVPVPPPRTRMGRPAVWARLLVRALRMRADAYHFHDPELLPLGLLLAWLTRRPVVYDAHEYYRDEIATRPWLPRPLRRPIARAVHAVETIVARRIAAVVAVNEHMASGFRERGARHVVAVHNYPPLASFPMPAARASEAEQSVAYIGLLTADRGLATVWQAGRELRGSVPAAHVEVFGRVAWSGLAAGVPRDPERWRLAAGVYFRGVVPATDIPAALARVTVGWIPFRDTPNNAHTIPLKLLEYMAAGIPVVASDLPFIRAIVHDARCGVLVPPDDPSAHARALASLLSNPEDARTMGGRGRQAVLDRYSWEAESVRLVQLYDRLTGRGGRE